MGNGGLPSCLWVSISQHNFVDVKNEFPDPQVQPKWKQNPQRNLLKFPDTILASALLIKFVPEFIICRIVDTVCVL